MYLFFLQLRQIKSKPFNKCKIMFITSIFIGYHILGLIFLLLICFAFKLISIVNYLNTKNKIIYFMIVVCFQMILTGSLMMMACGYYQIKALNDFLETILQHQDNVDLSEAMRKVSILHDKLCDLFDSISEYYLHNNLFFVTGFTYFYVFFIYSIFVYMKYPSYESLECLLNILLWCTFYTPAALWMMTFSSFIEAEGCKFGDLVEQLGEKTNNQDVIKALYIMMLQIEHRSTKITCGLFVINWNAFFLLFGSIFSFSVIIIQFHDVFNQ